MASICAADAITVAVWTALPARPCPIALPASRSPARRCTSPHYRNLRSHTPTAQGDRVLRAKLGRRRCFRAARYSTLLTPTSTLWVLTLPTKLLLDGPLAVKTELRKRRQSGMASSLGGFLGTRFNHLHHTLRSSIFPWNSDNLLRRILPIALLLIPFSILPVALAQSERGLHLDSIDTPPQQCGSFTFTWSGGAPPYTLLIKNATDGTILRVRANGTYDTTATWPAVDIVGGAQLLAELDDSSQDKPSKKSFTIQDSDEYGCLGSGSSTSSTVPSTSFAPTASEVPTPSLSNTSTPTNSSSSLSSSQKSVERRLSVGAIAGIVVGLAALILLSAGAFLYFRRRRRVDRAVAGGILGGAKYRAARNSVTLLSKAVTEQPVTFWDSNLFVREKTATTQVRDSSLSPLVPCPDLCFFARASRAVPSLHSKGDDELVSLVDPLSDSDSDLDASEVMGTRPSPRHLSPSLDPTYSPPASPANALPGHLLDGTRPTSATGGDAGSRSHGSRP